MFAQSITKLALGRVHNGKSPTRHTGIHMNAHCIVIACADERSSAPLHLLRGDVISEDLPTLESGAVL